MRAAVDQAVLVGDLIEMRRLASSAAVRPLLGDLASLEDEHSRAGATSAFLPLSFKSCQSADDAVGGSPTSCGNVGSWKETNDGRHHDDLHFCRGAGATLNRVTGGDLSSINGTLKTTGSINRNGVVIGSEGRVLTGGSFLASTRDIANGAFMTGEAMTASGRSAGGISNSGAILAREGDVMLIGRSVDNAGDIYGPGGTASLLAADSVLLTTVGGPSGIYVSPGTTASGNVTHTGRIEAAAAALKAARGDVYTLAGNRTGLDATGTKGGSILLGTSAPRHRAGSTSRGR